MQNTELADARKRHRRHGRDAARAATSRRIDSRHAPGHRQCASGPVSAPVSGGDLVHSAAPNLEPGIRYQVELARVVLGDHDADAGLVRQLAEHGADAVPGGRVEVGERLIHEQQDGATNQRGGNRDKARFAGRELVDRTVDQGNDLQPRGHLEYAGVHDGRGDVPHGEGESDFVVHGFGGEPQPHILRDEPDETGGVAWGS